MTALCDVNIWIALAIEAHPRHRAASAWLSSLPPTDTAIFCRATQQSFLRLITTAAVVARYGFDPLTNAAAWSTFDRIVEHDRIALRTDDPAGLDDSWRQFAGQPSPSPKLWMDAYLAAFARAGRYQLVTTDKAFRQFRGLDLLLLGDGA